MNTKLKMLKYAEVDKRHVFISLCNIYVTKAEFEQRYNLEFEIIPEDDGLGDAIISYISLNDDGIYAIGTRDYSIDQGVQLLYFGPSAELENATKAFCRHFDINKSRVEQLDFRGNQ